MRTFFKLMAAQIFECPKWPTKIFPGCVSQNAVGTHLVIRGVFVPNGHNTDNSSNWISQTGSRLTLRRSERPAITAGNRACTAPQPTVIRGKYAFSHSAASKIFNFLSRTPFLAAYIMRTFFTLMKAQNSTGSKCPTQFFRCASPNGLWQSLSNSRGFCARWTRHR
jgi:hypothetical protein